MTKPTLIVLAAGMGSRYGGLKQLDSVGPHGETIIDYSIFDAIRAGFGKIVFIIRRDIENDFRESVGNKYADKIQIEYAFQELDKLPDGFHVPQGREKPWGTGHAILVAKDLVNEPFAVINGDDFYGRDSFKVAADYLVQAKDGDKADYCMVGYQLHKTLSDFGSVARGICESDSNGYLKDVVETLEITRDNQSNNGIGATSPSNPKLTGNETVSMNMWGFTPSIFGHLTSQFTAFLNEQGKEMKSEFFIPSVINNLITSGQANARILTCDATWFGITYREDKPHVQSSIKTLTDNGDYPAPLWS